MNVINIVNKTKIFRSSTLPISYRIINSTNKMSKTVKVIENIYVKNKIKIEMSESHSPEPWIVNKHMVKSIPNTQYKKTEELTKELTKLLTSI